MGSSSKVKARVTKLELTSTAGRRGATEATVIARVGEGIVTTIGSSGNLTRKFWRTLLIVFSKLF